MKESKRKRASTTKGPEPKNKVARKSKGGVIPLSIELVQLLREEEEVEEDDSGLVARARANTKDQKATESVRAKSIPPRAVGALEKDLGKVPESSKAETASHRGEQTADMDVESGPEALRDEENSLSDPLGAIEIGDSPSIPSFSEGMIREARSMKVPSIEVDHEGDDLFYGYFIGIEDIPDSGDLEKSRKDLGGAPSLFNEAHHAMNRVSFNSLCRYHTCIFSLLCIIPFLLSV